MDGFIPVFEEKGTNLLVKIDGFEDKIKELNKLNKEYDTLKKEIKEAMLKIGKDNNLKQVKWTTPKGIQITCSIGQPVEKGITTAFDVQYLINNYPDIYKECMREKETTLKSASSDRLVITLPKED